MVKLPQTDIKNDLLWMQPDNALKLRTMRDATPNEQSGDASHAAQCIPQVQTQASPATTAWISANTQLNLFKS